MTGQPLSTTVTEKVLLQVLPLESLAEQVTVLVPTGNNDPEAGTHTTLLVPSTASRAVMVENETEAPPAQVALLVIGAGMLLITGHVVSTTLTGKVRVQTLLRLSRAVHVTVLDPIGKREPEAGVHDMTEAPSTVSTVAMLAQVTMAPLMLDASTEIALEGKLVALGHTVSTTETV